MTEFITRSCKAESRYEVIIKTDSEEHYKATEDFARRLIDHEKPMTNADRVRAMADEELAQYFGRVGFCNTVIPRHYCLNQKICSQECVVRWLQQPAEGE